MFDDPRRVRDSEFESTLALFEQSQFLRLVNDPSWNPPQLSYLVPHEIATWVVVIPLLHRIIDPERTYPCGTGLHLNLRIMYPWLIIEERLRQKARKEPPVQKPLTPRAEVFFVTCSLSHRV